MHERARHLSLVAMRWRLLLSPAMLGARNMAMDEALMRRAAASGEAVLRVYGWRVPTISLGRNQPARGRYDLARIAELGIDVVRRPTGGRAILHDHEVTYSVTAPASNLGELRESYDRVNRLLVDGLRRLGVESLVAKRDGGAPPPSDAPCFEKPTAGELTLQGRKLAGSAQWRDAGALLQHGSILIHDDQVLLSSLLRHAAPQPSAPATLGAALGRDVPVEEIAEALFAAVRDMEDQEAERLELDEELEVAVEEAHSRYGSENWTWRL